MCTCERGMTMRKVRVHVREGGALTRKALSTGKMEAVRDETMIRSDCGPR